jgi:uncharacterized protein (TIGR03083 family)
VQDGPKVAGEVLQLQRDGIVSIAQIAARFADDDWTHPSGCLGWTAQDLAGHVMCVADLWHNILDRAEAGDAVPVFAWEHFDTWNADVMLALPRASGPDRIARFVTRALEYVERLPGKALPLGMPSATISAVPMTVGVFARIAPAEWHLHAWDLARALGGTYQPEKPDMILDGLDTWLGLPPTGDDPWPRVLNLSGRGIAAK